MKNFLSLILLLLLTSGCATFQVNPLNHDPIYDLKENQIDVTIISNEFQLNRLLRNSPQYTILQPINWQYNNHYFNYHLFNHYIWFNGHFSYIYTNQMWNDWFWGYPNNYGIGWFYSWNSPYGWNNYYGWNNGYLRDNVAYHSSRRVNNQRTVLPQTTNRGTLPPGRRVIRNTNNFNTRGEIVRVNPPPRLNRVTLNQPQTTRKINSKNKN
jgi:hypothetical protein